jgi:hypothetical protein
LESLGVGIDLDCYAVGPRVLIDPPAFCASREMSTIILESTLTCPECGFVKTETMPTDACQWFYECEQCGALLQPKPGDCCVFCSYGTVPCPPIQEGAGDKGCCG